MEWNLESTYPHDSHSMAMSSLVSVAWCLFLFSRPESSYFPIPQQLRFVSLSEVIISNAIFYKSHFSVGDFVDCGT